jgi:hypothetical protein
MATLKFSVKLHKDGTGSVIDILTGHPSYASGVILRHLPECTRDLCQLANILDVRRRALLKE